MRRMPGVHYPDPTPAPGGPAPEPEPHDEHTMALRFVRTAFDPPLPDPFADWIMHLHFLVREGTSADKLVLIPRPVQELGYTFDRFVILSGEPALRLDDSLRVFGRDDLLDTGPAHTARHAHEGCTSLVAALVAHGIRTTTTLHHQAGGCTVRLSDEQAQTLADRLLPKEGSVEDDLALALELLNEFVDSPRPTPCVLDHHGHCQEHHDDFADESRFAQHEGHALLVRHNVRTDAS